VGRLCSPLALPSNARLQAGGRTGQPVMSGSKSRSRKPTPPPQRRNTLSAEARETPAGRTRSGSTRNTAPAKEFGEIGTKTATSPDVIFRAELHHPLDACPIVPASVEDDDFPGRRQMPHIALNIHLRLLALGRRRQRDDAKHTRTDALRDRLDHSTLAGPVASLEHDDDLEALGDDPES
jgi:hypothetical protein